MNETVVSIEERVVEELMSRGMNVSIQHVNKNGYPMIGISFKKDEDHCICPTAYMEDELKERAEDDFSGVCNIMQERLMKYADVDTGFDDAIDLVKNKDYVLANVIPTLQRVSNDESLWTTSYRDLEVIYRILLNRENGLATITIRKEMFSKLWNGDILPEEIISHAHSNLEEIVEYKSMFDTLKDMMPISMIEELEDTPCPMVVATNKYKCQGASIILLDNVMRKIADEYNMGDSMIIIPSSIHEVILLPGNETDEEYIASLIPEVNGTTLDPVEVLSDHPYIWNR